VLLRGCQLPGVQPPRSVAQPITTCSSSPRNPFYSASAPTSAHVFLTVLQQSMDAPRHCRHRLRPAATCLDAVIIRPSRVCRHLSLPALHWCYGHTPSQFMTYFSDCRIAHAQTRIPSAAASLAHRCLPTPSVPACGLGATPVRALHRGSLSLRPRSCGLGGSSFHRLLTSKMVCCQRPAPGSNGRRRIFHQANEPPGLSPCVALYNLRESGADKGVRRDRSPQRGDTPGACHQQPWRQLPGS